MSARARHRRAVPRRAPARARSAGAAVALAADGGQAAAERVTVAFQRQAVLRAARGRWQTPRELSVATELHLAVVAYILQILGKAGAIVAREDGRYRAAKAVAPR
jgi:hypothetical protein